MIISNILYYIYQSHYQNALIPPHHPQLSATLLPNSGTPDSNIIIIIKYQISLAAADE